MSEIYVYILVLLFSVFYLNSNIRWAGTSVSSGGASNYDTNLMIIEHLAKHASMPRNYRKEPENYRTFGYAISGSLSGEEAHFQYKFPLVESNEVTFTTKFHPVNFSGILDCHGVTKNLDSEEAFKKQWNRNGFYFHSATECGIDYNHVISISTPLNHQIAEFILSELQRAGKDNYQNRISAALNFVQYIPYGVPDFDTGEYIYGGISLPHESVAISYADCDSKAAMMAGILLHLISAENMVLVACVSGTTPHMVIGVSDLPYPGQRVDYKGKSFLLVETTTPATLHEQDSFETNTNIEIVPIIT